MSNLYWFINIRFIFFYISFFIFKILIMEGLYEGKYGFESTFFELRLCFILVRGKEVIGEIGISVFRVF